MSGKPAPAWLAELQAHFGAALRTPLDRSTGTLRATPELYDAEVLAEIVDSARAHSADRLAVYNRQYWFRLFGVLQTAYPLTVRLLGHWRFNDFAARFLRVHPPRDWDLDRAPDGFDTFLVDALADEPARDALLEAAQLDSAWRAIFRAPATSPFAPSPEDAARLLDAYLEPSPASAIVVEHWPLIALKRALASTAGEAPMPLPPRSRDSRAWLLVREPLGIRQHALESRECQLLLLLQAHTVRDALGALEALCGDTERAALPAQTQRWLAQSVARGCRNGIRR